MNQKVLTHYLQFSIYTNAGLYEPFLRKLPSNIREIGDLIRRQIIHRTTLAAGNTGTNAGKRFGDMQKVPWYHQPEDDILPTVSSMLAEFYRRNPRGFIKNRVEKDKLVLTCRFVAILMASILKSKGIPCRVRAGHAPYFDMGSLGKLSADHWINQYWSVQEKRWITIDVDGSWSLYEDFDPYDMPEERFDFPADAWLHCRHKKDDPNRFWNAKPERGLIVVLWSLFYDFHCLMNDEIIYSHVPEFGLYEHFETLSTRQLQEIDDLALLMRSPDTNFTALQKVWNTNRKFRLLKGGLL